MGFRNVAKCLMAVALVGLCAISCARREAADQPSQQRAKPKAPETTLPLLSRTISPASLLKRNPDGSLLMAITPHVYMDELGCTIVMDEQGNGFSQMYYVIAFSLEGRDYYTIWGVEPGKGPPISLDRSREYTFLVKPYRRAESEDESVPCEVLEVWDQDELLYRKSEEPQPADTSDKE